MPQKIQKFVNACLSHAQDLLTASKRIQNDENLPNIAYNLAVLAMEEIGKAGLVVINHMAKTHDASRVVREEHLEDHVRKLFWAIWGPSIGREIITQKQIETSQNFAKQIHETRLRGLYVDIDNDVLILPQETISESEAEDLISLASTRLKLERAYKFKPMSKDKLQNISWFLDATKNIENRRFIFSSESMKKLAEVGHPHEWMKWLKQQFEDAEAKARNLAERELKRSKPSKKEALQEKWKLKIRFYTNSHSIRPKSLNWWNKINNWIKLYPVNRRKNELLAEFILPKAVPLQGIWWTGWTAARRFVTALNIGSLGFFWWYVPKQISRYYEDLKDIKENEKVIVERSPKLELDWRQDALTEQDLRNASLCFAMLPTKDERVKHEPFNYYLTGLGFLSKNDIHLQFEANSFDQFYKSLKSGMRIYGDWDGATLFSKSFDTFFSTINRNKEERDKYLKLGKQFEKTPPDTTGITLSEVATMKLICDAYFIRTFQRLAKERIAQEKSNPISQKK